ncbi:MAG: hypothetical protein QXJ28_01035 [Candidatus Pacearchaeota archaeon]
MEQKKLSGIENKIITNEEISLSPTDIDRYIIFKEIANALSKKENLEVIDSLPNVILGIKYNNSKRFSKDIPGIMIYAPNRIIRIYEKDYERFGISIAQKYKNITDEDTKVEYRIKYLYKKITL